MLDFGSTPPRSLASFGVAGLLAEGCKIYYDSLFNSRGIGRVSDVLVAQLREQGLDELRLRAVLLFSFFDALGAVGPQLAEPLTIECGLDSEKVAIGISFLLSPEAQLEPEGMPKRIAEGAPGNPFESLLALLANHCDHLVIRAAVDARRVEVVALMAIPGKMEVPARELPTWVPVGEKDLDSRVLPASEYVQIGDVDYAALLHESSEGDTELRSVSRAIEKDFRGGPAGEEVDHLAGKDREDDLAALVKGRGPRAAEPDARMAKTEDAGTENIRISGVTDSFKSDMVRIVAGQDDGNAAARQLGVKAGSANAPAADDLVVQPPKSKLRRFIDTVLNFGQSEEDASGAADGPESVAGQRRAGPVEEGLTEDDMAMVPAAGAEAPGTAAAAAAKIAEEMLEKLQKGSFQEVIGIGKKHVEELKKDSPNAQGSRWMEGFMERLTSEQQRLTDAARKAMATARQREHEFRRKEQLLIQESRRKDELLHQKNTALLRSKEQLSNVNALLEKSRKESSGTGSEDASFRQKYNGAQKMGMVLREENAKLIGKIEEMKAQVTSAQAAHKNAGTAASTEVLALKQKMERLTRQHNQLKTMNDQLLRKSMAQAKPGPTDVKAPSEETKKRLESTNKALQGLQKELEQTKLKAEERSRDEMRIKGELARAQTELKATKAELLRLRSRKPAASSEGAPPESDGGPNQAA